MSITLETLSYYAKNLQDKGDFVSATQIYETACDFINETEIGQINKNSYDATIIKNIFVELSKCYEALNDSVKSKHYIRQAFSIFKDDPDINYKMLKIYLFSGNLKKAVDFYFHFVDTAQDEKSKILLYAELNKNEYRYSTVLLKMMKSLALTETLPIEDRTIFSHKAVELELNMEHPKLSICILTKNDEKTIKECLDSAVKISKDIIILDLGSKDATKDIAKRYSYTNIYDYEFDYDYSKAKNKFFEYAKGDWILYLDANDSLTAETCQEILAYISDQKTKENYSIYCIKNTHLGEDRTKLVFHYKPCLFKNNMGIAFKRPVHEDLFHPQKDLDNIYCDSLEIKTILKQKSEDELKEENSIYRKIIDSAILNNPDPLDNYYYYQFSALNYSLRNNNQRALEDHYKSLALYKQKFEDKKDAFYIYIMMSVVKYLHEKTDNQDAIRAFIEKILNIRPDYPDALYYLGLYYEKINNIDKALEIYKRAYELFQDNWNKYRNGDLPSIGDTILYLLSEKFECLVE